MRCEAFQLNGDSRLEYLLATVLVAQFQRAHRTFGFKNYVSVFCISRAGKAQPRRFLRSANLDGGPPMLRDQPKQYRLLICVATFGLTPWKYIEACAHSPLCIDNFQRTPSEHRRGALGKRWMHLLQQRKEQKRYINYRECNEHARVPHP